MPSKPKKSDSIQLSQAELDVLIAVLQLIDDATDVPFSAFYESNPQDAELTRALLAKLEKLDKG